jgi:hypothetical protein
LIERGLLCHLSDGVPGAKELLASPGTSFWFKEALQAALQRDPLDAAASVLVKRCSGLQVAVQREVLPKLLSEPGALDTATRCPIRCRS